MGCGSVFDPAGTINPATGWPMANEHVDVMGNPWGMGPPDCGGVPTAPFSTAWIDEG